MSTEEIKSQADKDQEMSIPESSEQETVIIPTADIKEDGTKQITTSQSDFTDYTSDGNFCVYFKLIRNHQDIEDDLKGAFYPDFVHQFFGETEKIFGYKKPVLKMFYSASRLKRFINFEYEDKLNLGTHGIEPDDVMKSIESMLQLCDYTSNIDQFSRCVDSQGEKDFRPPGTLLQSFEVRNFRAPQMLSRAQLEQSNGAKSSNGFMNGNSNGVSNEKRNFCIYKASLEDSGFLDFQARMQSFVMWFIDAANIVDVDDNRWDYFLVFEKFIPLQQNATTSDERYYFAGYSTVYRYYAYPDKIRPRVSQMLLLPPYRKNTLGTNLLQTIYNWYAAQTDTLDMTAEDPNEEFIYMRDTLDCKNCFNKLDSYKPEKLAKGWSEDMAREAQDKLKLNKRQARKVYEILKLKAIVDSSDSDDKEVLKNYRLEIKNRLNAPHQKAKKDCEKYEKRGVPLPEELRAKQLADIARVEMLNECYEELETQYKRTIRKLNQMID